MKHNPYITGIPVIPKKTQTHPGLSDPQVNPGTLEALRQPFRQPFPRLGERPSLRALKKL